MHQPNSHLLEVKTGTWLTGHPPMSSQWPDKRQSLVCRGESDKPHTLGPSFRSPSYITTLWSHLHLLLHFLHPIRVWIYLFSVCTCVHACGDQGTTSGVIPWPGSCQPNDADWPVSPVIHQCTALQCWHHMCTGHDIRHFYILLSSEIEMKS